MRKGLLHRLVIAGALLPLPYAALAEIYKVVDAAGNVSYTDQAPADGTPPMDLPELSVVDTDYDQPAEPGAAAEQPGEVTEPEAPTPRELRRMYSDFRITRPAPEETFWGTANTVVVSWHSATALQPGMSVRLFVDEQPQAGSPLGMVALTLDRGEHQVYAELVDARGRRVVATPPVTFFVKQASVNSVQPRPAPHSGT